MIRAILKLFVVASEQVDIETEIAPLTKSLKGSFKNPSEFDYKIFQTIILASNLKLIHFASFGACMRLLL